MKKSTPTVFSLILGSSLLFHSCVGSFGTWNQLKNWNEEVEDKFMNKFIFYAARVIPVYEICYLSDVLVLNPIEYWSGKNPVAEAESIQMVKCSENVYSIITNNQGYTIVKKGDEDRVLCLLYNNTDNSWSAVIDGRFYDLVTKNEDGTISVKLDEGTQLTINPSEEGKKSIVLAKGQKLVK